MLDSLPVKARRYAKIVLVVFLIGIFAAWRISENWDSLSRRYQEHFHKAATAMADARAEADWNAQTRIVERHLLSDVTESGDNFAASYDGSSRVFLSVTRGEGSPDCGVTTLAGVKEAENDAPFAMKDLENQASKPIYLVRHASTELGWEIQQGDESCFVTVIR